MTDTPDGQPERRWRGQTAEERRAARRVLLIDAGIELFGTQGYTSTSVKAVCDLAGLTERYFYEAFDDREDLLSAVYDILIEDAARSTIEAIDEFPDDMRGGMKAGLKAFATRVTEDPRRARIQQIEVVGVSETLEEKRRDAIHAFAHLIETRAREMGAREREGAVRLDVIALGLVGAVNEQLIDYVLGRLDLPLEDLVANQVAIFDALAGRLMPLN